jgi:hypothetical protein
MSDQQPDDRPSRVRRPRATISARPRRAAGGAGSEDPAPGAPTDEASALPGGTRGEAPTSAGARSGPEAASASSRAAAEPTRRVGSPQALEVRWGGIGRSDADDVAVTFGGVGLARARQVSVELGGLGLGLGEEVRVSQAVANAVVGSSVELEQSFSRVVVGARVTFRRASGALVVIAGRVDGEVRTLVDWRGALAFGAATGLAIGLLRRR